MKPGNVLRAVAIGLFATAVSAQKITQETIVSAEKKRTYYLYVPAKVKPDTPESAGSGRL